MVKQPAVKTKATNHNSAAADKALSAAEDQIWKWLDQALDDVMRGKLPDNYGEQFMGLLREVEDAARMQAGAWIKEAWMTAPTAKTKRR